MFRTRSSLAAVAVLAALMLLVAACGGGDDGSSGDGGGGGGEEADVDPADCPVDALEEADGPVEISLWYAYSANIEIALQTIVEEYNASQDQVVVTAESQGVAYEEVQRTFNSAIQSGDLPNVTIMEDTQNQFMADSGVVVPAAACIEASGEDPGLLEGPVGYYTIEGVQWPGAFNMSSPLLYFNRGHFEEAGLDPASPPQTLDEIRAAAEAIQDSGASETPFVFIMQPWFLETWMTGIGQTMVNEDNGRNALATEATVDNDAFLEVLTWLKDMNDDGLMLPFPATEGQINHYLALAQQNGSMGIETSAASTAIESFLKGELDPSALSEDGRIIETDGLDLTVDIAAAELPGVEEAGRVQVAGGAYFMTNTGTPEQIAASWDFLNYVNSVDAQVENNLVGSYIPTLPAAAEDPTLLETWETTLSGGFLAISSEQLANVDPDFPGPVMGPYTDEREIVRAGLEALLLEGASPEDVQAQIQEELTAALQQYEEQNF
jgi:sn-glycerol 3-phosphate transport system substrate-binding protein